MVSPLANFANGELTFQLPTSGTTTDQYTGNVVANVVSAAYRVFIAESGATVGQDLSGLDVRTSRFQGYVTDPTILDDKIVEGMLGTLSIDDGSTYDVTLIAARGAHGRKGIGKKTEEAIGHAVILDAVRQE